MDQSQRLTRIIAKVAEKFWVGHVLQVMRIYQTNTIPTAGVMYDKKIKSFVMMYNPDFFAKLTDDELFAVQLHELAHITEKHVYLYNRATRGEKKRLNFAMDLVINQKIANLPKGGLKIEHFKDKNGVQFAPNLSVEQYYDLLENSTYENPDKGDGEGEPQEFDEHSWDDITEQEAMEGMQDLLQRAQNHYQKQEGTKCKEIQDLLEIIGVKLTGINFKHILLSSLRRATPGSDKRNTWSKPSRRLGKLSPGKIFKPAPTVDFYGDTSGSMSYDEINDMLETLSEFFNSGAKKVNLALFHDRVYFEKALKKGFKFEGSDVQQGGTDLQECFDLIEKNKPEIAIFFTDGYYGMPKLPKNMDTKLFFIIKKGGNENHPLKDLSQNFIYERK